jgi:hypothetical protein
MEFSSFRNAIGIATTTKVFWGLWLLPLALLVYKSRFLPRFQGVWLPISLLGT